MAEIDLNEDVFFGVPMNGLALVHQALVRPSGPTTRQGTADDKDPRHRCPVVAKKPLVTETHRPGAPDGQSIRSPDLPSWRRVIVFGPAPTSTTRQAMPQ